MATFEKNKPLRPYSDATVGSNNPFPTKVAITLNTTDGKPRLTKPSRNPLVLGTILQGPVFMNLAIPNPPLNTDKASVKGTTDPDITFSFDTSRQMRMWIWGMDSK